MKIPTSLTDLDFLNKRKKVGTLFSLGLIFALPAIGQETLQIAAIVNDGIISGYDLQTRIDFILFSSRLPSNADESGRIRFQVLNNLINEKLKLQKATQDKIKVFRKEIYDAISKVEKRNNMVKGGKAELLNDRQIDPLTFERKVEADIAWSRVIRNKMAKTNNVDKDTIDQQIKLLKSNKGKPEYLVAEIFILFDTANSATDNEKLVHQLYKQIKKGAPFNQVARSFSQSASATRAGNLGWIREDQLDPELAKIVKKMSQGGLSRPVKGPDGYYILLMKNKRISRGIVFGEGSVSIQQIFLPLKKNALKSEVESQLNLARSVSNAAQNCQDMENLEKEIGTVRSGKLQNIKLSNLAPSIRKAAQDLDVGKASAPIRTSGGVIILMVCHRTFDKDETKFRLRVATDLSRQRAELISRRELMELRRSAFIEIRL